MDKQRILEHTEGWISERFSEDTTGHDQWHMKRVVKLAKQLAEKEKADSFICQLAAYVHDVPDEKLVNDHEAAMKEIFTFLKEEGVPELLRHQIWLAFKDVSFKGQYKVPETLEGKVVQDADRLDALGAIGIARTFAYGGATGAEMFNPNSVHAVKKQDNPSQDNTTINHFYEKLVKLKDLMNTESAKKMAAERHQYMEKFLTRFYAEWNGDD
ncbi:HD domain-containing protein [Virgibacillus sp. MSP4-1]|uniref:HD domain-containing protein n=1 Tax=Virgibacillus sp. MSP4-1 TaxID=2700081 RepID=UPI0003A4BFDD|nr:HD domain-containing protein [Virgibacillus sp. MSP4-1]